MKICYKLDKDLGCEQLCFQLQKMFKNLKDNNIDVSNKMLIITLADIIESTDSLQLKIEHKQD
jgi:hypothetical protein